MPAEAAPAAAVVDIVLEDPRWQGLGIEALADRAARAALATAGLDPAVCEVSLLAADDARLAALNRDFRGREGPTNVLSWPAFAGTGPEAVAAEIAAARAAEEGPVLLGDVALAYETCAAEAAAAGRPLDHHVAHLVVHGVLHLIGHDHAEDGDAARMESLEAKSLASLGVPDPYRG